VTTTQETETRTHEERRIRAAREIETRREQLIALSRAIHENPEVSWQEHESAALLAGILRDAGFEVVEGAYGIPTAIEAVSGDGDLTVAVCAEYDALPGIGHACGHNVIATAGIGAALALAPVAREAGLRVKLLGTPAEEHGGGKVEMLRKGAWEDVDFSLMVHGMTGADHSATGFASTAVDRFEVVFTGKASHAAGAPERGINAGAAATVALTAFALLRQQLPKETNMNAFVSHGGDVTNIIPDRSVVQVEVRAYDLDVWRDMKKRVLACFEGAAIATGCGWSWSPTEHLYAPLDQDAGIGAHWDRNLAAVGRTIVEGAQIGGGSTDMGNVSQVVPSIHPMIGILGHDAAPHSIEFTAAAGSAEADAAAIDAAVTMAWTVLDVAADAELRADLLRRSAERPEGATRVTLEA